MNYVRKPEWLKTQLCSDKEFSSIKNIIQKKGLHTICTSGRCPNLSECWGKGTATIMILGEICTRTCKFCNTLSGKPSEPDPKEPQKVAESIQLMNLRHAVITSVDRDDLPDRGASHWANTICTIKKINPNVTLEVLIPDFDGNKILIDKIIAENPEIISHNLETIKRLTPLIRSRAKYQTSLSVLQHIAENKVTAKTGIMVGLGETESEIFKLMDDVIDTGCRILTIGQYMQPSKSNIPVVEYIHPKQFENYKETALDKGFKIVESAPLVRSSYCAEKHI